MPLHGDNEDNHKTTMLSKNQDVGLKCVKCELNRIFGPPVNVVFLLLFRKKWWWCLLLLLTRLEMRQQPTEENNHDALSVFRSVEQRRRKLVNLIIISCASNFGERPSERTVKKNATPAWNCLSKSVRHLRSTHTCKRATHCLRSTCFWLTRTHIHSLPHAHWHQPESQLIAMRRAARTVYMPTSK